MDINTTLQAAAVQRELSVLERMFVPGTMLTLLARSPAGETVLFTLDEPEFIMRAVLRETKWLPPMHVHCEYMEGDTMVRCPLPVTGFRLDEHGDIVAVTSYRPPLQNELVGEGEVAVSAADLKLALDMAELQEKFHTDEMAAATHRLRIKTR